MFYWFCVGPKVCGIEWSIFCYHKYQYQYIPPRPRASAAASPERMLCHCVVIQLNGIIQFNINIEHCLCSRPRTAILCHYAVYRALYLTTAYNSAINMRTLI